MSDDLPMGWVNLPLELVGMPSTPNIDPSKFPNEVFELYSVPSYADDKPEILPSSEIHSTKQSVEMGDVLLCKIVPHLNRVWIVKELLQHRQIASGEWIVIRSKIAISDYIRYALTDSKFRSAFMATSSGVGGSLMRARPKAVAQIPIPIAPLNEQQRIVDKLDRLGDRHRTARNELSHIPKLIARYKQAVLAAAFRGDLTADWREENKSGLLPKEKGINNDQLSDISNLPNEWIWTNVSQVAKITGGLTKNQSRKTFEKKVPYLRVANVYANELRLDEVLEIGVTETEWERSRLQAGDLLVVEGNGSIDQIGRVALWNGEIEPCAHQNHLIKVRAGESISQKFLLYWLLSPSGRRAIELVASSSAGLHTLSISKVMALPLPLCSI